MLLNNEVTRIRKILDRHGSRSVILSPATLTRGRRGAPTAKLAQPQNASHWILTGGPAKKPHLLHTEQDLPTLILLISMLASPPGIRVGYADKAGRTYAPRNLNNLTELVRTVADSGIEIADQLTRSGGRANLSLDAPGKIPHPLGPLRDALLMVRAHQSRLALMRRVRNERAGQGQVDHVEPALVPAEPKRGLPGFWPFRRRS